MSATSNPSLKMRAQRALPLLRILTVREFRTRYRQSGLDVFWSLITPVVILVTYGIIFTTVFKANGGGIPYVSFAWSGLVTWTFFAGSLTSALPSLLSSSDLISKVYFPREVIPLSMVGTSGFDFCIALVSVLVLAIVQGVSMSWHLIEVIPVIIVLALWAAALSIFGAVLTVFIRDVNHASQLALRVGFFATPVMYDVALLPSWLRWIAVVNPAAVCIEGVRDTMLRAHSPDWPVLIAQGIAAVTMFWLALLYTRSVEHRMVDVI